MENVLKRNYFSDNPYDYGDNIGPDEHLKDYVKLKDCNLSGVLCWQFCDMTEKGAILVRDVLDKQHQMDSMNLFGQVQELTDNCHYYCDGRIVTIRVILSFAIPIVGVEKIVYVDSIEDLTNLRKAVGLVTRSKEKLEHLGIENPKSAMTFNIKGIEAAFKGQLVFDKNLDIKIKISFHGQSAFQESVNDALGNYVLVDLSQNLYADISGAAQKIWAARSPLEVVASDPELTHLPISIKNTRSELGEEIILYAGDDIIHRSGLDDTSVEAYKAKIRQYYPKD